MLVQFDGDCVGATAGADEGSNCGGGCSSCGGCAILVVLVV